MMEKIIESFDYKIYTKVEGNGNPILLLHSLWGDSSLFDNIVEKLSARHEVIRIDFPGHGNSAIPIRNFTFKEFSFVLNDIFGELGIVEKICLMGHSMGGFAALAFAKEQKEKVSSMVLMHTLIGSADHKSIKLRERQARLIIHNKKELLLQVTNPSNFALGNDKRFPNEFDQLNKTAEKVVNEGVLAGIKAINTREASMSFLAKSGIPLLSVVGKQDQVYNVEDQLSECSRITEAELLLLQNSGHLSFIEEEALFVSGVANFLDSVKW